MSPGSLEGICGKDTLESAVSDYIGYQERLRLKCRADILEAEKRLSRLEAEASLLDITIQDLTQMLEDFND